MYQYRCSRRSVPGAVEVLQCIDVKCVYVCHSVDTALQQHVHLCLGIAHMHTQMCIHGTCQVITTLVWHIILYTIHFTTSH